MATISQKKDSQSASSEESAKIHKLVRSSAQWLARIQQTNGGVGVSASIDRPYWPTSYALLLWTALEGDEQPRQRATRFLLGRAGTTFEIDPTSPIVHDTTIAGWPWVDHTHSWIEPTAMAVLALYRQGLGDHPRTQDGLRLIRDRAIETGGWNYGNKIVFDTALRPRPAPTGLALLALAQAAERTDEVDRAIDYLESALPPIRSAQSLCWGLLGLTAWDRRPVDSDTWLADSFERSIRRSDPAVQLGYLLLASGDRIADRGSRIAD